MRPPLAIGRAVCPGGLVFRLYAPDGRVDRERRVSDPNDPALEFQPEEDGERARELGPGAILAVYDGDSGRFAFGLIHCGCVFGPHELSARDLVGAVARTN